MLACVAGGILTWLMLARNPPYTTQVGEQRSIALPDGSLIELNARSSVRVRFTSNERAVELLEGQALFRVAKGSRAGRSSSRATEHESAPSGPSSTSTERRPARP